MAEDNKYPTFKEIALEGRTPEQFLVDRVTEIRRTAKRENLNPTKHDIAALVLTYMQAGILTEENVAKSVSDLGLTPEEAEEFIPKTMPETREFLEEQDRKEKELAEQRRKDFLQRYTQEWGLSRLDIISNYFKSQLPQAELVNPRWQSALEQYSIRRPQVEELLGRIDNPKSKAGVLMQELYALSNIHPSEATQIFKAEQETKSYAYLDSLFETAVVMYANDTGKDPDFENIEAGPLTFTLRAANNPEHMVLVRREAAMQKLAFGAKSPDEIFSSGKPMFTPLTIQVEGISGL